jgi:hypothetical protein
MLFTRMQNYKYTSLEVRIILFQLSSSHVTAPFVTNCLQSPGDYWQIRDHTLKASAFI